MNEEIKKLHIAMICDPIGSNKSGVVMSTLRFSKLLTDRGHHVIFIAANSDEYKKYSTHNGVYTYRFRSLPVPKSGGWNLAFPTVKELKKVFIDEKIDVVHIILPMSGAIVAIKAARALGVKIVAHSHSQPENLFMDAPKFLQPTLNKTWNKYLAWLYSKSEALIYPTEMAKSLLHSLGKKDHTAVVISNGIHTEEFSPMPVGDFFTRYNIPEEKIKLVFVGRLFPEKSVDTLIRAIPHILQKHTNIHVLIVGGGHLREKLETLAHELGVSEYITFLGLVSEEDKIHAYNASDIFVLPSLAELEGMVVLEAMACGKSILIADSPMSASRYFVDGNGFLFAHKNPEHLAEQALQLILDENLRKTMGKKSLENSKNFDIMKSVEQLEDVYYFALNHHD